MFQLLGKPYRHCDGLSRRSFLTAGACALTGLSLPQLLRAEAASPGGSSQRAIVNIHLDGGPPQMDTIDLKPEAPVELRGEFSPIPTVLPGFQVCELLPKIASIADRIGFIRSLVGAASRHDAFQCQSGFDSKNLASIGGRPATGCVVGKLLGDGPGGVPAFVDLMQGRPLARNSARPGFLGAAQKAFRPDISNRFKRELEEGMKAELAAQGKNHTTSLTLSGSLDANRLRNREQLRSSIDRYQRNVDASGMMGAFDRYHEQAASILTSGQFAAALDLEHESPAMLARYTPPNGLIVGNHGTSDQPHAPQKLLLARRLIEAGVRCVSVSFSDFDTHSDNYPRMRQMLPMVDFALHAFITDLEERGLLETTTIVVWGEFGRTPKINDKGGRDHWPAVGMAMMAGGGLRGGQVIGSTDRTASAVKSQPVHYKDVVATMYRTIGINPHTTTIPDPTGRPQYLLDAGRAIEALV